MVTGRVSKNEAKAELQRKTKRAGTFLSFTLISELGLVVRRDLVFG